VSERLDVEAFNDSNRQQATVHEESEMTRRKALWRQVEDMTKQERIEFLGGKRIPDVRSEIVGVCPCYNVATGERYMIDMDTAERLPLDHPAYRWWIPHTTLWLRVRRSWIQGKVWREFSRSFRAEHPICGQCDAPSFCAHHLPPHNLDHTVLEHGFLEALEHPEYFAALCSDCHYEGHREMIESERAGRGRLT